MGMFLISGGFSGQMRKVFSSGLLKIPQARRLPRSMLATASEKKVSQCCVDPGSQKYSCRKFYCRVLRYNLTRPPGTEPAPAPHPHVRLTRPGHAFVRRLPGTVPSSDFPVPLVFNSDYVISRGYFPPRGKRSTPLPEGGLGTQAVVLKLSNPRKPARQEHPASKAPGREVPRPLGG